MAVVSQPSGTALRRALLVRRMFEVLQAAGEPQPPASVLRQVRGQVALTPYETSRNRSGVERFDTFLRFASSWAAAIGWMTKGTGWWLTVAGAEALETIADDEELYRTLTKRYRQVIRTRKTASAPDPRWAMVVDALNLVEAGSWTAYGDLAELAGVPKQAVGQFVAHNDAPNVYRVLHADGRIAPQFSWADPDRSDDPQELLEAEGIEFDVQGRASQQQRLRSEELAELLRDVGTGEPAGRRAWLIRGSSVNGSNLVPVWLHQGSVSLAASTLRPVESALDRAEVKTIVDEDYQHKSYAARKEKTSEFHAFLSRMQIGDVAVTTSGGRVYLGVVTGDAEWVESADKRSNLRRTVEWHNVGAAVEFAALPAPLPAKLSSQSDVVDLTEELALLERLLGVDLAPTQPEPPKPLVLADADDALAETLLIDKAWLQEIIDLLRERRQLILYGPPGTGKTYVAQHLAWHLTERNAVKLVQFHPSYAYEDFFEGYRPVPSDDGKVGFELRPGPFRRIVEAARQAPSMLYVLIIDEINRGNLAKVFGELYFLLEYRDQSIGLLYSAGDEDDFTLPGNVFLIGTMNTADRSIALVDTAMRRRFAFVPLHPAEEPVRGLLGRWLATHGYGDEPAQLLAELNRRMQDRDYAIGPSYLMRGSATGDAGLDRIWRTSIMPLIEELHYGENVDLEGRYGLAALRKSIAAKIAPVPGPE